MAAVPSLRSKSMLVPAACAGFGLALFLLLPAGVTVMNDDFGYLASVLDTVRHGRPWTDAWLEPWAASFSALCAVVWKLTGSFLVATQGVQAACSAAAAGGAYAVFRGLDLSPGRSALLAGLLLTMPALLWKQVEFTAVALYLPCLLWAVWAALHGRWRVFFVAWLLAFASRQSAAVWLVLPAGACVRGWLSRGVAAGGWRAPAGVLAGALPMGLLLHFGMNQSLAQAVLTSHTWDRVELPYTVRNLAFGTTRWLVAAGWGALLQAAWAPGRSFAAVSPRRLLAVLAVATVGALLASHFFPIFFEHDGYAGWQGRWFAGLALAAGAAGWLLAPGVVRLDFVLAGLGALVPVALRTATWDYYFLDVALLGLPAIAVPAAAAESPARLPGGRWLGYLLLASLAAYHLRAAWDLKCRVDREYAIVVLTEKALRENRLPIADISYASYGLSGWLLHQHYIANEGRGDVNVGDFTRYVRRNAARVEFTPMRFWRDSQTLARWRDVDDSRIAIDGVFRVGWIWYQRIGILRSTAAETGPADIPHPNPEIRRRVLPLDDREWRTGAP